MKLRNKKTGEIVETDYMFGVSIPTQRTFGCPSYDQIASYNSLAELNEDWEDYEGPKEYWCIDWTGGINHITVLDDTDEFEENKKEIGNYFETREEAEKAVKKLKAWKRLEDKGFRFNGWKCTGSISFIFDNYCGDGQPKSASDDLDLLFGGEE